LRFCQLSTSVTRFQHQTTPAQILHETPETLQSPEQGIARSPVILRTCQHPREDIQT
jgi:hypothetical protein